MKKIVYGNIKGTIIVFLMALIVRGLSVACIESEGINGYNRIYGENRYEVATASVKERGDKHKVMLSAGQICEKQEENYTEKVTEKIEEKIKEKTEEKTTEKIEEKTTEKTEEETTEQVTEKTTEAVTTKLGFELSDSDYNELLRIVEAEAGNQDDVGKILVANVIFNRVNSSEFPNNVTDVIYQHNSRVYQFEPVLNGRIYSVSVAQSTKECVDRAINGEDYSMGALYFTMKTSDYSWFNTSLRLLFVHGDHYFYAA